MTPRLVTSGDDFKVFRHSKKACLRNKEIEKEIQKINKEIAKLQWDIKNEVLTPHQKAVKNNKIKALKEDEERANEAGGRVESSVSLLPETVDIKGTYGIQNR